MGNSEIFKINKKRAWKMLMELSEITLDNLPYTRRSFSDTYLEGRAWLHQKMLDADLSVSIDNAGNLIGTRPSLDLSKGYITIGSHSDTVPSGGRFDGIAGVIAGLEIAMTLQEKGIELQHGIQIIDFLAEEPSEWGTSCIGSRGVSGYLNDDILSIKHPETKEELREAIKRMGGDPKNLIVRNDIAASFELHIEQGKVLESENKKIGIVSGIVGIRRVEVLFEGQSNHVGTTPMLLRQDALIAASNFISKLHERACDYNHIYNCYFVATCGAMEINPNAINVIPNQAKLILDIRSDNEQALIDYINELNEISLNICEKYDVNRSKYSLISQTKPVLCDTNLINCISRACDNVLIGEKELCYRKLPSGAGHDTAFMAKIAPSAMVFVPSKDGISHRADEWTSEEDLITGIEVLLESVCLFDGD